MEEQTTAPTPFTFTSHDTALCIIPPRDLWEQADRLRGLYDKAHGAWPPHLNLIYPFVAPELLDDAANILGQLPLQHHQHQVKLGDADAFISKHHNTIFLRPAHGSETNLLRKLRDDICNALGSSNRRGFQPHMTLGQSHDALAAPHHFLFEKARLVCPLVWDLSQIAILVRDSAPSHGQGSRLMKLWATLDISSQVLQKLETPEFFYEGLKSSDGLLAPCPILRPPYHFSQDSKKWQLTPNSSTMTADQRVLDSLVVASYNVLAEFEWPPQSDRHASLVENILSSRAAADILVLEEVTDHFLPFLLANEVIRERYPFSTHGPPDQPDAGPLPSLLNVLVLSKFPFTWGHLPFQRKHKGSTMVQFSTIGTRYAGDAFRPWVLAACHLSQGLTDGAIVAKKNELQRMLDCLASHYEAHPWILAGDFNLSTSSYTIETARKKQDISSTTIQYLQDIDHLITDAGFTDTWLATRLESGESSDVTHDYRSAAEAYEGEQGATFDPLVNSLAAKLVGTGLNNRPQRYDRILVKSNDQYRPQGFNMFGQASTEPLGGSEPACASDHWGIRCLLVHSPPTDAKREGLVHVSRQQAPPGLGSLEDLKQVLESHGCLPTESDRAERKAALDLLKKTLLSPERSSAEADARSGLILRLVPVGSYGLGVWTSSSDIDCLCIGSISSKIFFALALQRLRRAASEGIKILRRVSANSGYMLELEVRGIKVDLQYCAATSIAER